MDFAVIPEPAVTVLTKAGYRIPATRICRDRGGRWFATDVLMQYGQPVPLDLALRRVSIGRTVFVAREDAGKVMEAVGSGSKND